LNDGKVGRPFKITYGYIVFLAVVRYLFSTPYRLLRRMGVKPIIKPGRNARADIGPPERRLFSHNIQGAWGEDVE